MSYAENLNKYYKKHLIPPFEYCKYKPFKKRYKYFMIIPTYNEYDYILNTLESIDNNELDYLSDLLVVLVINNSKDENNDIVRLNSKTHKLILKQRYKYEFIIIDCYSKKNALEKKYSGVGYARKIGMDFCLEYAKQNSLLCCMDADTLISNKYFKNVSKAFKDELFQACTINFSHQKTNNNDLKEAILKYENKLKLIASSIKCTGSPYGYISMGSTMVCTAKAYIAIGGMSKKNVTEDFYFLQSLAKYSKVQFIEKVLVYPSPRCEQRVYLGTGFRMKEYKDNKEFTNLDYSTVAYKSLKILLSHVDKYWGIDYLKFEEQLKKTLNNNSIKFLKKHNLSLVWNKFTKSSKTKNQFILFFNQWFDALKTIKFLKELSEIR